MSNTLMDMEATIAEPGDYIELTDNTGHHVHITLGKRPDTMPKPQDGQVVMNREVKVERHDAVRESVDVINEAERLRWSLPSDAIRQV
jgi:hypothetical protein